MNVNSLLRRMRNSMAVGVFAILAGLVWGGTVVTGSGRFDFGMITDFGSVFVNGIEYFTNTAAISINGQTNRPESELKIGMPIKVTGTLNSDGRTGQANTIIYNADLIGVIDGTPTVAGTGHAFSIYGLAVTTGPDTIYSGVLNPLDLGAGDAAEVAGFFDANTNSILAKRIELRTMAAPLQLTGRIGNLSALSFTLGNLVVNYTASVVRGSVGALGNGMRVRVRAATQTSTGTIDALSIERVDNDLDQFSGNATSLQGVVANFNGSSFTVGGLPATISRNTSFSSGNLFNMVNGAEVEVRGTIVAGAVAAANIAFVHPEPVEATGQVAKTDGTVVTLFTHNGIGVRAGPLTQFSDKKRNPVKPFGIGNIAVGDRLFIRGTPDANQVVVADKIERTDPNSTVSIQGRVTTVAMPNIFVATQMVSIVASTVLRDVKGIVIGSDTFYGKAPGQTVTVSGTFDGNSIVANRVDLTP